MIWLNPWAWAGVLGIALLVLVHLLARGHAPVHRFPTLRFLVASRLLPTRRTRIHDAALLALRAGVIVLACAALAHPLLLTRPRARALDRGVARAIVVDTSASMRRATGNGRSAVDSARREARALAQTAQASLVVESNDPAAALRGGANWLAAQSRRAELVVISDFQRGLLDSLDLDAVPKAVGVRLVRIAIRDGGLADRRAVSAARVVSARAAINGGRTDAAWSVVSRTDGSDALLLLGGETDHATLGALHEAGATAAVPLPIDTARRVALVFPGYADRRALDASIRPTDAPWMVDLLAAIEENGMRVTRSGVAGIGGRSRLVLVTDAAPGSLDAVRMAALARRATSIAPAARESEPESIPDATLAAWQRPSADVRSQVRPRDREGPSDARWLWIAALALLLIEQFFRRRRRESTAIEAEQARAA
jgi:hypothetical protein